MAKKILMLLTEFSVLLSAMVQFVLTIVTNTLAPVWIILLIAVIVLNVLLLTATVKKAYTLLKSVIASTDKERREQKVSKYLLNWIRKGQRVAILSRDLSWVKGEIEDELCRKAKNDEVIVFIPKKEETGVSRRLMSKGAEVKYYLYGTDNIQPMNKVIPSRFIIARYESAPRLTTPVIGDLHINEEYASSEPPAKISSDMIDIMRSMTHRTVPLDNNDETGIAGYLADWLTNGGRCFILSRDLSWANHPDIRTCLCSKAKRGEITIFMHAKNTIAQELLSCGADVRFYDKYNYTFKNRFIIAHWGTTNAKISMRSIHDDVNVNHIYDSTHRIYAYAIEIADFLDRAVPAEVTP